MKEKGENSKSEKVIIIAAVIIAILYIVRWVT